MLKHLKKLLKRIGWLPNKSSGTQMKCSTHKKMDSNKKERNYKGGSTKLSCPWRTTVMSINNNY